jgi:hypothetical protein
MPKKRTLSAPLALALDGSLLLNAVGQLDAALVSKVAAALAVPPAEVFIGTRLAPAQRTAALTRVDDAAAEAAARIIHGERGAKKKRAAR